MKIVSFIEEDYVIRKILKHCNLWKEPLPRPPLLKTVVPVADAEPYYDFSRVRMVRMTETPSQIEDNE